MIFVLLYLVIGFLFSFVVFVLAFEGDLYLFDLIICMVGWPFCIVAAILMSLKDVVVIRRKWFHKRR